MKKYILAIFLGVFCYFSQMYAAEYTPINETPDHALLANQVGQAVADYVAQYGTSDLDAIRTLIVDTIHEAGGWNGLTFKKGDDRFDSLARIEGGYLIVGCGNQDLAKIPITTENHKVSYGDTCSSYTASWSPTWSNCSINSNWTPAGTITCLQTVTRSANLMACGVKRYETVTTCEADICESHTYYVECITSNCPANMPSPVRTSDTKKVTMDLNNPTTISSSPYANNADKVSVKVNISGVTNDNRSIVGWGTNGVFSSFSDASNIASNRIVAGTGKALNFSNTPSVNISAGTTSFTFSASNITSRSPFHSDTASIAFNAGNTPLSLKNVKYDFKKPFTGKISTWNTSLLNWDGKVMVGTLMKHKVSLIQKSTLTWAGLQSYYLNDFSSAVKVTDSKLQIQGTSVSGSTVSSTEGTIFQTRINTSATSDSLVTPSFQIAFPMISYSIDGQQVKYYLTSKEESEDLTPLSTNGTDFLGVRVIGGIQGGGKSEFTGQKANISEIATSETRTAIRKNAYTAIQSMTSGQIANGVKFVQGADEIISGDLPYETLVVKDGNVIMNGNLNPNKKKLGIIVLKDSYDSKTGYATKGNIYITPNVTTINASMYADGGLISVDANKKTYPGDSSERTEDLSLQLFIYGNIFTRNTIGGAVFVGGQYYLPGKVVTQDFNSAMQYDLNYLRRGDVGCDKNNNHSCSETGEYKEPTIIKYNPEIQTNPPKLFQF